ncbi:MAG: glycoside hydrolase family 1 protein [Candidatus Omnitrophica bacterium]|nr:glycoside hydrolase family 1 protein [Candidatus Omnitrophota bacterium]MDD5552342.1 glycoside hydrolase family 1 protein [Candidatus Omnitrophota bacterium]
MMKFPKDFLWGAATSAYQVEGNNKNSDWWEWESSSGKERSAEACRHYQFYEQDFDLAKGLNHNAHRLSIEWSRIEPEKGKFSESELGHYLDVITSLKKRGIEPLVTLHHFTNPLWLSRSGGWASRRAIAAFLRYCNFIVPALAKHVRYWFTINEPNVYVYHAYILGVWPPQKKSYFKAKAAEGNLLRAHIKAYRLIYKIYRRSKLAVPNVSFAHNTMSFVPCTRRLKDRLAARLRDNWYNFGPLNKVIKRKALDFIGINYYSRQLVDLKKWGIRNLAVDTCDKNHHPVKKNSLGWDIYPQGLYELLLKLRKYNLPVIISENGICTQDDNLRWEYIHEHLKHIHMAMNKGAEVRGYLYWSLLDNFEWDKGFGPRFGLIHVDYDSYRRTVKESARKLAEVSKTGYLAV